MKESTLENEQYPSDIFKSPLTNVKNISTPPELIRDPSDKERLLNTTPQKEAEPRMEINETIITNNNKFSNDFKIDSGKLMRVMRRRNTLGVNNKESSSNNTSSMNILQTFEAISRPESPSPKRINKE